MRKPFPPYLERRPSGFYFRRRFPQRKEGKCRFDSKKGAGFWFDPPENSHAVCMSLFTTHLTDAKRIVRRLTAVSDALFDAVMERRDMPVSAQLIIAILADVRDQEIRAFEARRSSAPARDETAVNAALVREAQIQQSLREAIALGKRDTALDPLLAALTRAGVVLDPSDLSWAQLAHNTNRVLLEVSEERARREQGQYSTAEPALAQIASELAVAPRQVSAEAAPPLFRSARVSMPADAFSSGRVEDPRAVAVQGVPASAQVSFPAASPPSRADFPDQPSQTAHSREDVAATARAMPATPALETGDTIEPASRGLGSEATLRATIVPYAPAPHQAMITTNLEDLRIDASLLSAAARDVLRDPMNAKIEALFACYTEVKLLGYGDEFHRTQKRTAAKGRAWKKNSKASLDVAARFWVDVLDNCRVGEVTNALLDEALDVLRRVPALHGKKYMAEGGFRALVDRADEHDIAMSAASDAREVDTIDLALEDAEDTTEIKRIRAETFLKHGRAIGKMGRFLEGLGLAARNPFALCSWNSDEERDLKENEQARARMAWDDRLYKLFRTPDFQGQTEDPGSTIFWSVMIAVHLGLRMQEVLQLQVDDFSSEDGHPYLLVCLRHGNQIKSYSGQRKLPIHPNLIELGLLDLVERRQNEREACLFPDLPRGQSKGTQAELASKAFGYYRKKHNVFFPGLDFHALRTTFHTHLRSSHVPDSEVRRLMGHAPLDEGERNYSQSLRCYSLLPHIEKVRVDIIASLKVARESQATTPDPKHQTWT